MHLYHSSFPYPQHKPVWTTTTRLAVVWKDWTKDQQHERQPSPILLKRRTAIWIILHHRVWLGNNSCAGSNKGCTKATTKFIEVTSCRWKFFFFCTLCRCRQRAQNRVFHSYSKRDANAFVLTISNVSNSWLKIALAKANCNTEQSLQEITPSHNAIGFYTVHLSVLILCLLHKEENEAAFSDSPAFTISSCKWVQSRYISNTHLGRGLAIH